MLFQDVWNPSRSMFGCDGVELHPRSPDQEGLCAVLWQGSNLRAMLAMLEGSFVLQHTGFIFQTSSQGFIHG